MLRTTRSQLRRIPLGLAKKIADQPALANADALAESAVMFSERVEEVLREINAAIVESDAARLRKYLDETDKIKASMRAFLATRNELTAEAGEADAP